MKLIVTFLKKHPYQTVNLFCHGVTRVKDETLELSDTYFEFEIESEMTNTVYLLDNLMHRPIEVQKATF